MRRTAQGPAPAPILVTGAHRSGTTWVGRMLALDPSVSYIHEPFNPTYERTRLRVPTSTAFVYVDGSNASQYRELVQEMLEFRWQAQLPKVIRSPKRHLSLAAQTWADHRRARRPLLKDPLALFAAPWLTETFGMQTVMLVRHPAGFVSSILRLGWTFNFNDFLRQSRLLDGPLSPEADEIRKLARDSAPPLDQAAHLWRILNGFTSGIEPSEQWRVYRHEDLAAEPVTAFEQMYARLGLAFTSPVRGAVVSSNSPTNAAEADAKDVRRSSVDQASSWRNRLDERAVARVRDLTEEVASRWYSDEDWNVGSTR